MFKYCKFCCAMRHFKNGVCTIFLKKIKHENKKQIWKN